MVFTALVPDYISEQKSNWWDRAVSSQINCADMTVWKSQAVSGAHAGVGNHCPFAQVTCLNYVPESHRLPATQTKRAAKAPPA